MSVFGDVLAFAALALNQLTGSSVYQGVAAVLIALVLIRASLRAAEVERARALVLGYPGVTAIRQLMFTFLGPGRIWIVARIDIDDGLAGDQVKALVRGIESGLKHESENVYRADIVPTSGTQAVNTQVLHKERPLTSHGLMAGGEVAADGMCSG